MQHASRPEARLLAWDFNRAENAEVRASISVCVPDDAFPRRRRGMRRATECHSCLVSGKAEFRGEAG
jgi:hypothetical protein